jgi:hypothetical protein
VNTLGCLLALRITSTTEQERAQIESFVQSVQEATIQSVKLAFVARGYTGAEPEAEAESHGIRFGGGQAP